MPAAKGNQNAVKFGPRWSHTLAQRGVRIRRWPKGHYFIERECKRFSRMLGDACLQVHGELTVDAAMAIDSATAWHAHGIFLAKLMRDGWDELKTVDKANLSEQAAKARDRRTLAVAKLGLGRPIQASPFDCLVVDEADEPEVATNETTDEPQP